MVGTAGIWPICCAASVSAGTPPEFQRVPCRDVPRLREDLGQQTGHVARRIKRYGLGPPIEDPSREHTQALLKDAEFGDDRNLISAGTLGVVRTVRAAKPHFEAKLVRRALEVITALHLWTINRIHPA